MTTMATAAVGVRQLALFDAWTTQLLTTIDGSGDRPIVASYTAWHHRRRLARAADQDVLRPWSTRVARQQIRVAVTFLAWLTERDTTLARLGQVDVDAWFSTGPTTRTHAIKFLHWSRNQRLCDRRLRIPHHPPTAAVPMAHPERVALVARLAHDPTITLDDRIAGLLVALYAQPLSRITRLTRDDLDTSTGTARLRLGVEHLDLGPPLEPLLAQLAARTDSRWLFPGRPADRPLTPHGLAHRLRRHGITRAARVSALHDLARQLPAVVLADLVGYNPVYLADHAKTLATDWNTYAALTPRART